MSRPPSRSGPGRRRRAPGVSFSGRELRDLLAGWVALSVAFGILFNGGGFGVASRVRTAPGEALGLFAISFLTAGLGFMLHELAHKVVAVRFGQAAEFRAQYGMLFVAVAASLAGFIFAAPGAVYHSGRITDRESGLVALAGPATNAVLAALFVPVALASFALEAGAGPLWQLGAYGAGINLLLAGFNMLPFGPLDGRSVLRWNAVVYVLFAVPAILLGLGGLVVLLG